jgi:hypothetical protein
MADWRRTARMIFLADGVKKLGTKLKALKRELMEDNKLDLDEIRFLMDLRTLAGKRAKAKKVNVDPAFDDTFFKLLYRQLMADGQIDREEAGWLREVLFHDGKIDKNEKAFLQKLKKAAKDKTSPEFEKLYEECMAAK